MLRVAAGAGTFTLGAYGALKLKERIDESHNQDLKALNELSVASTVGSTQLPLPTRELLLSNLKNGSEFDVLVIGGGATGCGVALDAVTRGLKTALVEKYDYACGTSSRSTKLIHGGVRYLQKAVFNLDIVEYKMVKEALHERANLLNVAPHLAEPLPIMLPVYKWWQVPYFWAGLKMYDLVAGKRLVKSSYYVNKEKTLELFPMLKRENLCGAVIYYDGQHNDSRTNLALALTAIRNGATCLNHVEVVHLLKKTTRTDNEEKEVVCGARVRNTETGEEWDVHAKSVINATGPFTDSVRKMAKNSTAKICQTSAGVHIILPEYYSPKSMGLLDPATSDGRVIFFLPWEGRTIAGTTDSPCEATFSPIPRESEVNFILDEVKQYFNADVEVRREDVLAAWSGIRPLVVDPSSKDTKSISRNHVIEVSENNLITIAGGKWTTYRAMASDAVDAAIKASNLSAGDSKTTGLVLEGGEGWSPTYFIRLVQDFGLEPEVAKHLARSYGNKAPQVAKLAALTGNRWPVVGKRLVVDFPYIEAEIRYGVQEYALNVVDMIGRRLRIAFLDVQAADEILPRVIEIMGEELGWDESKRKHELNTGRAFLDTMGYKTRISLRDVPVALNSDDISKYQQVFQGLDTDKTGHLSLASVKSALERAKELAFAKDHFEKLVNKVELDSMSKINQEEFLKLVGILSSASLDSLGKLVKNENERTSANILPTNS
ncbi:glycerol-3-phosphate dehydrogenase, mitochondrial-like [Rhopilema esculentum]|uniref:glycerol-3-phosphate dehydrogenase, mitochondrial-like n=1 Tax=Rhopilema esculentum TaxID=499914 RepID=UPI0031D22CC1|eukprot:gene13620-4516_t